MITKRSSIQCLCSFRGFVPTEAYPPRATLWKSPHARQAQSRLWVWPSPPRGTKCHGVRDARSLQDGGAGGKYAGSARAHYQLRFMNDELGGFAAVGIHVSSRRRMCSHVNKGGEGRPLVHRMYDIKAFFQKNSSPTALARMSRAIGGTGGRRFALHQA